MPIIEAELIDGPVDRPQVYPGVLSPEEVALATEQAALRQAGIDKLMALGLTEEEAYAVAGVTPPPEQAPTEGAPE